MKYLCIESDGGTVFHVGWNGEPLCGMKSVRGFREADEATNKICCSSCSHTLGLRRFFKWRELAWKSIAEVRTALDKLRDAEACPLCDGDMSPSRHDIVDEDDSKIGEWLGYLCNRCGVMFERDEDKQLVEFDG